MGCLSSEEMAGIMVDKIIEDLCDWGALGDAWESLDFEIQQSIGEHWIKIILNNYRKNI